ncbi:hypothetical protein PWY87_31600 [Kribbella solani]|nr:hypothetical protein [Kribbella solani]MDX2971165.1 hypothetical protein [Kribbella solani]MDX3006264.1 hypothetical protein [Kribbella solani]
MNLVPIPGTSSGSPAESVRHTSGSRLPSGRIACQPGPTMCPGWIEVVASPPERVSAFSSSVVAAFAMLYSPTGRSRTRR